MKGLKLHFYRDFLTCSKSGSHYQAGSALKPALTVFLVTWGQQQAVNKTLTSPYKIVSTEQKIHPDPKKKFKVRNVQVDF